MINIIPSRNFSPIIAAALTITGTVPSPKDIRSIPAGEKFPPIAVRCVESCLADLDALITG